MKVKYLILGGGPAGLTFANVLLKQGITDFLVVEKEACAGGLCRSEMVDGSYLDIGGGHFLDVRRPDVNKFLFEFMPENEWSHFERNSKIAVNGIFINHPFEANIWQFDDELQKQYLESISQAGCNKGVDMPDKFIDWIYWKLGEKISEDYMIPYNTKMFSNDLNELGTYWLEKLPNVSYEETLISCREKKPYGKQPGHAQFYYPKKYGYGEVWIRMATALGNRIIYSAGVSSLDVDKKSVTVGNTTITADNIITTIPWKSIDIIKGLSESTLKSLDGLRHSSVEIRYCPESLDTDAQWIYYPDLKLPYHRILVRSNFAMGSRGFWYETRKERVGMFEDEAYSYMNDFAYPLNTIGKNAIMSNLISKIKKNNIFALGRWGEHMHYNSDVTVDKAMRLCYEITK